MPSKYTRQQRVADHIVERLAALGVGHIFGVDGANIEDLYDAAHFQSGITAVLAKHEFSAAAREQLFYEDLYSYNRFHPSQLGGLAAMFPGLESIDVTDLDGFAPAVVSVECAADEIPPFAPFLAEPTKTAAREEGPTVK